MTTKTIYTVTDAHNKIVGTADSTNGACEVGNIAQPSAGDYLVVRAPDGSPVFERAFGRWHTYPRRGRIIAEG